MPRPANYKQVVYNIKRHGNLYPQIYDFENLLVAYREARKGKRFRREVLEFTRNKVPAAGVYPGRGQLSKGKRQRAILFRAAQALQQL